MRRDAAALLLAFGGASPAAAWLTHPFLDSRPEESWTPPRETNAVDGAAAEDDWTQGQVAMGWSPRPTEAPKPLFGRMLQPRLDDYTLGANTCGFISKNANSFTCITSGATCTFTNNNIGCCDQNKDCNLIKTTCIDYRGIQSGRCNLPDDFHTLCCGTSSLGSCYTWILSTTGSGSQPDHTFTLLDCASTSGTGILLDYDPIWSSTHIFSSKPASAPVTATSASDTSSASQSASSTSASSGGGGGSSTNVGAIAGGTVGGVAALAIVGAGLFFFLRRKKNGKDSASPASTTAHMSQYGPVPTGPSGPTSPGTSTIYPSGVPPNFQGYSPPGQGQYDPTMQYYNGAGYPQQQPYPAYGSQSPGYGQGHSPDYTQQQQAAYAAPYNYQTSPVGSPPPPAGTSPSPGAGGAAAVGPTPVESPEGDGTHSNRHTASELPVVNPTGHENNRAELG